MVFFPAIEQESQSFLFSFLFFIYFYSKLTSTNANLQPDYLHTIMSLGFEAYKVVNQISYLPRTPIRINKNFILKSKTINKVTDQLKKTKLPRSKEKKTKKLLCRSSLMK